MRKNRTIAGYVQPYRYASPNIPLTVIRRFARKIADAFHPDKIILFGSYAYGKPHNESDVDLLVVMPASDVVNMAIRISLAFEHPFSMDLIVRTPKQMEIGLRDEDWFLREIVERGKVLYETKDGHVGSQSRGRLGSRLPTRRTRATASRRGLLSLPAISGEVPQSADARKSIAIPKTHNLKDLLNLLTPLDASLAPLKRDLISLTRFAVEYRYPGIRATTRRMNVALRRAERVRAVIRGKLSLLF